MDWQLRENVLSPARMGRYLVKYERDVERAGRAYDQNVLLASALMPSLHILEIAVRNAINRCLTRSAQRSDWWVSLRQPEFDWLRAEVAEANRKLASRNELASPDKIVAELTFGSWTRHFQCRLRPHPLEPTTIGISPLPEGQTATDSHPEIAQSNPRPAQSGHASRALAVAQSVRTPSASRYSGGLGLDRSTYPPMARPTRSAA